MRKTLYIYRGNCNSWAVSYVIENSLLEERGKKYSKKRAAQPL